MGDALKFCKRCNEEVYFDVEVMPDGYIHYAKATCSMCGKFIDWMKKPKFTNSKKEASRVIELKKQALHLLTEDFHEKYTQLVIAIYELEIEFRYATDNDFWQEDEINLHDVL